MYVFEGFDIIFAFQLIAKNLHANFPSVGWLDLTDIAILGVGGGGGGLYLGLISRTPWWEACLYGPRRRFFLCRGVEHR